MAPPIEPPPSPWEFPPVGAADENGIVGVGADLEPGTLLAAYRKGLFPMPLRRPRTIAWWSPDPRGVLPLDGLRVSRSLRKSCGRFDIRIDTAFEEVILACQDPKRPHGWIEQRHSRRPTSACTSSDGPTASKRGRRRVSSPAGCTASPSAGCSPASRCSIGRPTRRRWRWSASWRCYATRTPAARRAVDD